MARIFPGLALIVLLALGLAPRHTSATLHNRLVKAEPGVNGEVAASPKELRLWFAQKPDPALTTIKLMTADSTAVPLGAVAAAESLSVRSAVAGELAPGRYLVQWKTAGNDGHVIRGSYAFTRTP